MLLSMTGFGEAQQQQDALAVAVEVRTINSRYFKLTFRSGEGYAGLEPLVEATVRQHIKRGTVQVSLRVNHRRADDFRLNMAVLTSYREQIEQMRRQLRLEMPVALESLLALPGVVDDSTTAAGPATEDWTFIECVLEAALANMARMRQDEGRAMAADLTSNCNLMASSLNEIELRMPLVADQYRGRLSERIGKILADHGVTLEASDLVREIAIYAERSDISEEIIRLRSHLEQFEAIMASAESAGRKLEFVTQEMGREANTIGSKANDVQISRHVIEIKAAIERIREMIQNVE